MNMELSVDLAKCVKCGRCVADCNPRALECSASGTPQWSKEGKDRCCHCQHCLAICPTGALSIFGNDPADAEEARLVPVPADLLNLIKRRRSYRSYRPEGLDREILAKLKNMLAWVPTGCNDHCLFFGFIDDVRVMAEFRRDFLAALLKLIEANAPGSERFARYRQRLVDGEDVIFRGAPHMVLACTPADAPCADIDPVIALSYFELYAQSLGVGTLWCGLFKWALAVMPEFLDRFKLPEGYLPGYAMMFGASGLDYRRGTLPEPVLTYSMSLSDAGRAGK